MIGAASTGSPVGAAAPPVVVIGAGQAGLAVSHSLTDLGVEHTVLEQHRVAQAWRDRWDSFTLVTPNWTLDLPGMPYAGDDPEGHVPRTDIVDYLEHYAEQCRAHLREGVGVTTLHVATSPRFTLDTSAGQVHAGTVIVCTGAYQRPFRPTAAHEFRPGLRVMDATAYRSPAALPDGKVLVVGSGQTGVQLTEELHLAGRDVFLSCGRAPWVPRRLDGTDIVTWLARTNFFDQSLDSLPSPAARLGANIQATGARGGHDLHFRTLQKLGVPLLGRLSGVHGTRARFADDLAASVAFGDGRWAQFCQILREQLPVNGFPVPELPEPAPFRDASPTELDLRDFSAVIFTSGYRPDYSWIRAPVTDPMGFPLCVDGASTIVPGLYFCGVHFLRTRRSSLLFGVGADARKVARGVAARVGSEHTGGG